MIRSIHSSDFLICKDDIIYDYQNDLTGKLDNIATDFEQNIINEIVLWKTNRYSKISDSTFKILNSISPNIDLIDTELTKKVLKALINENGIQLPMASTILRFKNSRIYQIIDQRVYRILYGKPLKLSSYKSDIKINSQIDLYLCYLIDLRQASERLNIPFDKADRILYEADKRLNKMETLDNY